MKDLTLISHHLCPYVQRAVIVLLEKDIPHQRRYIDLAAKPEWFLQASPLGRVPLLLQGQAAVFESQVIVEYLEEITEGTLHPSQPLAKARHRSWTAYASETLARIGRLYSASGAEYAAARDALRQSFARVEQELVAPYFAGTEFYLVDAAWAPVFRYLEVFERIDRYNWLAELPQMQRWRQALQQRASVQQAVPEGYDDRLLHFLARRASHLGGQARLYLGQAA